MHGDEYPSAPKRDRSTAHTFIGSRLSKVANPGFIPPVAYVGEKLDCSGSMVCADMKEQEGTSVAKENEREGRKVERTTTNEEGYAMKEVGGREKENSGSEEDLDSGVDHRYETGEERNE